MYTKPDSVIKFGNFMMLFVDMSPKKTKKIVSVYTKPDSVIKFGNFMMLFVDMSPKKTKKNCLCVH